MATSPFDSALERREAAQLGMWAFLATEVLFFGPLFFGYVHARAYQGEAFVSASHRMHVVLGTLNTALLLTSSFAVALALGAARAGRPSALRHYLSLAIALGLAFLGVKGFEYAAELRHAAEASGGEARFYFLYYAMTGLHAVHLAIGIAILAWLWLQAKRFDAAYHSPVEVSALYWHFVDIVWVFLYPMFYLLDRYAA